jgi:HTH-type transcriptional regulator/antitoxin MqsA
MVDCNFIQGEMMNCVVCRGKLVKTTESLQAICLGVSLTLSGVERSRCVSCKEEFFDPDQAAKYSRVAREQYKLQTSLSSEDVVRIRKKLKLSQAELEQRLGLGPKVIVRWENGKVRLPGPVNALLKILDKRPEAIKFA